MTWFEIWRYESAKRRRTSVYPWQAVIVQVRPLSPRLAKGGRRVRLVDRQTANYNIRSGPHEAEDYGRHTVDLRSLGNR
jgi:hypothetical protein